MKSTEEHQAELAELRSDPKLSPARYDEIIALRLFLFDIRDKLRGSEDPVASEIRKQIVDRARAWGNEKDCV